MTENLLVLIGVACIVVAVGALTGPMFALLLLGVLLILMAYALQTQAPTSSAEASEVDVKELVRKAVEEALAKQEERHQIDIDSAVSVTTSRLTADKERLERELVAAHNRFEDYRSQVEEALKGQVLALEEDLAHTQRTLQLVS
jgi:flagellar biosynthesis component FlhA